MTAHRLDVYPGALVALLSLTTTVHAAAPAATNAAESLFREGRAAMKSQSYALACAKFEESEAAAPALGTLLNLALCEEARGHLVRARSLLDQFQQKALEDDDRRDLVQRHLLELAARTPRLTLVPDGCERSGCELSLDGEIIRLERASVSLSLDPGEHHFALLTSGRLGHETSIILAEGEASVRAIAAPPQETVETAGGAGSDRAPVTIHRATAQPDAPDRRTLAYVLGGTGAAGLVAALVTGLLAIEEWHTVERHCSGSICDSKDALSANSRGRALAITSTASFAVGAVALGAGGYLYFKGGSAPPTTALPASFSVAAGLSQTF